MNIVHITTSHTPWDTRILYKQCSGLAASGNFKSVTLLNCREVNETFESVTIKAADKKRSRILRYTLSVYKSIDLAQKLNADIIHVHDPELYCLAMFCRFTNIKVVVDVHENYFDKIELRSWMPRYLRSIARLFLRITYKVVGNYAFGVIGAVPTITDQFNNENKATIRNFPQLHRLSQMKGEPKRIPGKIVYTGGLGYNRGAEAVVKSFSSMDDRYTLHIYGRVNETLKAELANFLAKGNIILHGICPFEEVMNSVRTSCCGVICNESGKGYEYALPNKLFEYLALGVPVVCSNFPLWEELVVENDVGISVRPDDHQAIRNALELFCSNVALSNEYGNRCKALAQKNYNWANEFSKLLALYQYKGLK